jgi:hypothetical protein
MIALAAFAVVFDKILEMTGKKHGFLGKVSEKLKSFAKPL